VDEALVRAPVDPAERERFLEFLARPPEKGEPEPAGEVPPEEEWPDEEAAEAEAEAYGDAEDVEVTEVTPEELAIDIAERLSELNQDLALAFDAWSELPEEGRRMIVEQARYVAELFPHLRTGRR
jgi:hypothetical protein